MLGVSGLVWITGPFLKAGAGAGARGLRLGVGTGVGPEGLGAVAGAAAAGLGGTGFGSGGVCEAPVGFGARFGAGGGEQMSRLHYSYHTFIHINYLLFILEATITVKNILIY